MEMGRKRDKQKDRQKDLIDSPNVVTPDLLLPPYLTIDRKCQGTEKSKTQKIQDTDGNKTKRDRNGTKMGQKQDGNGTKTGWKQGGRKKEIHSMDARQQN
jgi:hypothetical protein